MPIELRGRTWFAYLDVPADVRGVLGRRIWRETLDTDSRSVAMRRAAPKIAQWKAQIAKARGDAQHDDAAYWRSRLNAAKTPEAKARVLEQIEMAAVDIGAAEVELGHAPLSAPAAQHFYGRATGQLVAFTEHMQEWLDGERVTPKTKAIHRTDVANFGERFKTIAGVTRPGVKRWATALIVDQGLKPKTVNRVLSALRGYWRFLKSLELTPEDAEPFTGLELPQQSDRENKKASYVPFTPEQVVELWRKSDGKLRDLIELGMWTGARREELCSLAVAKVDTRYEWFDVDDAKTAAGFRRVPIHPKLKATMKRLCAASRDGYVLCALQVNKYGDRGNKIGNQFGRLKTSMGYGEQHVFHSIRKTVATQFENALVPEGVAADIIGHDKPTMTYGLYSGGASFETKRDAVLKLAYPL